MRGPIGIIFVQRKEITLIEQQFLRYWPEYTGFYHWISNSDEELSEIIAELLFFGMIEIHFPPQRVVISVTFLHGFGKLFDVPRRL